MANLQSESSNHGLRYLLSQYWQDNGNPRTAGLPLIREGPFFTFCVIGVYLLFVTKIGPAMMRKRAPYQLRGPMLVYNSSMVVINFYFLFKSLVCPSGSARFCCDFHFHFFLFTPETFRRG